MDSKNVMAMHLPKASHPGPVRESIPILCVEDDSATRLQLVQILGKRYSEVLVAKDGAEGLALFLLHRPPIVITDIYMPFMDGITMARAIKRQAPGTHIIVTTSDGESEAILSAIDVGVLDYVLKPVSRKRIFSAIDKACRIEFLERDLWLSCARTESILESIGDAFFALDREWRFTYLNTKAGILFGASRGELLGRSFKEFLPGLDHGRRAFLEAMAGREKRTFVLFLREMGCWNDVSIFPQEDGVCVCMRDISEKVRHQEAIQFLAFHDNLTGLPNGVLLQERLEHAILGCKRSGQPGAVLLLDLDRFKSINDSLGHEAGDQVLQEVGRRLQGCLRDCDTVARLSGDEFVILLEGFDHPDNIHSITHRILLALAQEIQFPEKETCATVTGSLGIAFIPADGETASELMEAADTAMYFGKSHGRNTYHFYDPEMNLEKRQFLRLENALRNSLKNREFLLNYQPQYELRTGRLVGFEALARWHHPELGLVQPDQFIPLAEETGLILLLGDWVLENACSQARIWMDASPEPLRMAVNLSGRQFWQSDLVETISRGLALAGLPPERLELEITESMVMRDVDQAIQKMRELAEMGIHLSMDDFGTGYSSLAALKRFPIHTLKIDKAFVREVTSNPNDAAICSSIIGLAHTMNLLVIAEGIETKEQLDFLQERGCEIGQGYYFSRPVPAPEAARLIRCPGGPGSCG